ncbi:MULTISPECIES: ABC transporter permease [unclassified Halomonas]|uniref:ABC transporter permease n=1 Tax=unclassified Halomonas TaxID=2609666 RepID=UPI0021E41E38|nr:MULTISPECIES: ABC transporter permease [unclassified Halomonas]UYF98762.1 ABC transporter permease [Halomonas sp. GD1P12]WNL40123.1 ABC transporter permease [Halomonas sp. PAMB 3232]
MLASLKGAWRYRQFIATSIRHELVTRFARSRIGGAWMIIHPLAMVLIYALVLSKVLSAKLPGIESQYAYAIYLTAGMLGWSLFSELLTRCLGIFIDNANLMKKLVFPKVALPLIVTGSCLINNLALFLVTLVVFAALGHFNAATLAWVMVLTGITVLLGLGLGMTLGILNVFLRDIGQLMPIVLQFLFWFTPVVYPAEIVPQALQTLIAFNPLYHLVGAYHDVLAYGQAPSLVALATLTALGLGLVLFSALLFERASPEMVDAL